MPDDPTEARIASLESHIAELQAELDNLHQYEVMLGLLTLIYGLCLDADGLIDIGALDLLGPWAIGFKAIAYQYFLYGKLLWRETCVCVHHGTQRRI